METTANEYANLTYQQLKRLRCETQANIHWCRISGDTAALRQETARLAAIDAELAQFPTADEEQRRLEKWQAWAGAVTA